MHASSYENMQRCYRRHIAARLREDRQLTVLEMGAADVNGSYRALFSDRRIRYLGADLTHCLGVDVQITNPEEIPLTDGSVDAVVCGQMLEHCEHFWTVFQEMIRVLTPGGVLLLIAPSAGPVHRYPVDCYRFQPDAFQALARLSDCTLIESWHDERGPWKDMVGVFQKGGGSATVPVEAAQATPSALPPIPPGSPETELRRGRVHYRKILKRLHERLRPRLYLEIGVRKGHSLALARGRAIGVDPAPDLDMPLPPHHRLVETGSDDFFLEANRYLTEPIDLALIDGLHHHEQALRDFMNVERHAAPGGVAFIDDVYPNHPRQAERERATVTWTGDVWKLMPILARWRPDLWLLPLDTAPTGSLLVAGLDPRNRVLWDQYNPILKCSRASDSTPPADVLRRAFARHPCSPSVHALILAARAIRRRGSASPLNSVQRMLVTAALGLRPKARRCISAWLDT